MTYSFKQSIMTALIFLAAFSVALPLSAFQQSASDTELIIQWSASSGRLRSFTQTQRIPLPTILQNRGKITRTSISPIHKLQTASAFSTNQATESFAEWEVISFESPQTDIESLVNQLKTLPEVAHAQPNYLYAIPEQPGAITPQTISAFNLSNFTPNDPLFDEQTHHLHTNTQKAWQVSQGSESAVVAIIDTGLDLTHPDLISNAWVNSGEIANNNIDDDGNGFVDDIIGWDFVFNNNTPEDIDGHGTHVAGIALADTNNEIGISSAGFGSKVMILKAAHTGAFTSSRIASSLFYAIKNGAHIVNMSFGGLTINGDAIMESAVASANANGLLLVAAAGNSAEDVASANLNGLKAHIIPATYPGVLTVSAANEQGLFDSSYSNFGAEVELIAQGTNVLSLSLVSRDSLNPYVLNTGTSMAAPYISGLASLLKSAKPSITSTNMYNALTQTATDKGEVGFDNRYGFGMPDALAALQSLDTEVPVLSHTPQSTIDIRETVTLTMTATDDLISHQFPTVTLNYQYFVGDTPSGDSIQTLMTKNNSTYSTTLPEQTASHDIRYFFEASDSISTHNTRLPSTQGQTFTQSIRDLSGPEIIFLQADTTDTIIRGQDYYSPNQEIDIAITDNTDIDPNSLRVTVNGTVLTLASQEITADGSTFTLDLNSLSLGEDDLSLQLSIKDLFQNETITSLTLRASNSDQFSVTGADGQAGIFNAPNPFNPNTETTDIAFNLSQEAEIECIIYTLQLTPLKVYATTLSAGYHKFTWDGKDTSGDIVPNGVYPVLFKATGSSGSVKERFKVVIFR